MKFLNYIYTTAHNITLTFVPFRAFVKDISWFGIVSISNLTFCAESSGSTTTAGSVVASL